MLKPKDDREPVTVRLDPAFNLDFKVKAAQAGVTKQEIAEKLIREWVAGGRTIAEAPGPSPQRFSKDQQWHERLQYILDNGSINDHAGIKMSLEWAVTSIEAATGATAPDARHEVYARVDRANDAIALSIKSLMKEWVSKHPETEHGETKTRTEGSVKHSGRKAG